MAAYYAAAVPHFYQIAGAASAGTVLLPGHFDDLVFSPDRPPPAKCTSYMTRLRRHHTNGDEYNGHVTPEELTSLIGNPRETLETEYKSWIDLDVPEGRAVLVTACLALRNYGGGSLVIGFRDKTGGLQPLPAPSFDIREKFSGDSVARLVGRHSLSPFETTVHFVAHKGVDYPVIEVAGGIRTPAATKASIEKATGEILVKKDAIYTRTLDSNNTPSSSLANKDDWDNIMRVCVENRETDIGSFIRRHLSAEHLAQIRGLFGSAESMVLGGEPVSRVILHHGAQRFTAVTAQSTLPKHGAFEVGIFFSVPTDKFEEGPSRKFLNLLTSVNPNYWNGWPLWLNATAVSHPDVKPKPVGDIWQASLILLEGARWTSPSIDFWTASSRGQFYQLRGLWEDHLTPTGVMKFPSDPLTLLDAVLQLNFVAEAFVVGQAFARAMGCPETEKLDFSFRWTNIHGRTLVSLLRPSRLFMDQYRSTDNEASGGCFLPLDTAQSAIFQYVQQATKVLFQRFDGLELPSTWIQQIVDEFLQKRNY